VRSAVVKLSNEGERRRAHLALAEALTNQPERRAWHLADAAVGFDGYVAGLLEHAARLALRRGDSVAGVAALVRAADLSPTAADRSRRLAEAAYLSADTAGELGEASRLLVHARKTDPGLGGSLGAAIATTYLLVNGQDDVDTVHRLLSDAIETRAGEYDGEDDALVDVLHSLFLICLYGGRSELWKPFYAVLDRMTPRAPAMLSLLATLYGDPARATREDLGELDAIINHLYDQADPVAIVRAGRASLWVDRLTGCREALWRVVHDGRAGGAVASAISALFHLCHDDFLTGEWDEVGRLAEEGLRLCDAHGYRMVAWRFWYGQAIVAAARGDSQTTYALAEEMDRWAVPRKAGTVLFYSRHARGLAALGRGDFEDAYHELAAISPPGTLACHVPLALWTALDLVDAAVRTNRHAEAIAHSNAMLTADLPAISPRLRLVTLGSAAIAAPHDCAADLFQQALDTAGVDRWPFDLARVRLAYGERLRRSRATVQARVQLNAAIEIFLRLGAQPWAARAGNELRASGQAKPRRGNTNRVALTAQEYEIALLAAAGLTNKQIAERLYISHRTVSSHLHNAFPKLGVTSRAALRDALGTRPAP
jgi:DNA-binding CsgD family transcriptional regulator